MLWDLKGALLINSLCLFTPLYTFSFHHYIIQPSGRPQPCLSLCSQHHGQRPALRMRVGAARQSTPREAPGVAPTHLVWHLNGDHGLPRRTFGKRIIFPVTRLACAKTPERRVRQWLVGSLQKWHHGSRKEGTWEGEDGWGRWWGAWWGSRLYPEGRVNPLTSLSHFLGSSTLNDIYILQNIFLFYFLTVNTCMWFKI